MPSTTWAACANAASDVAHRHLEAAGQVLAEALVQDRRAGCQGGLGARHHVQRVQVQLGGDGSGAVLGLVARLGDHDGDRLADEPGLALRQRQLAARPVGRVGDDGRGGSEVEVGGREDADDAGHRRQPRRAHRRCLAWAYGLRTNAAWSIPGRCRSSRKAPLPGQQPGILEPPDPFAEEPLCCHAAALLVTPWRPSMVSECHAPGSSRSIPSIDLDTEVGAAGADQ